MTKQSPTLALDLSGDAASLQQLAFDGHWHEMARAGFNDNGLAEKMAFMRRVAVRLEGRRFYNTVWLPDAQIIERKLKIAAAEPDERLAQARSALATITAHPAEDFLLELGEQGEDGFTPAVAVRKTTLSEAKRFATSHGFNADSFSMNRAPEGFEDRIFFNAPPDPKATIELATKAAAVLLAVGLVLGGTFWADPFGWRNPASPDTIAAVAPETPALDEAAPEVAAAPSEAPEPLALPERAEVTSPAPDAPNSDIAEAAPVLLADQAEQTDAEPVELALTEPEAPVAPALDPLAAQSPTAELQPVADIADTDETPAEIAADAQNEPEAVEIARAASEASQAEVAAADDLTAAAPEAETPPAEIVVAREASTSILDDLAAAKPLPEPVVAAPEAEASATEAPELAATETTPTAEVTAQDLGYEVIAGLPDFTLLLRSGNSPPAPIEIGTVENITAASATSEAVAPEPVPETVAEPEAQAEPQPEDIEVVSGRPAFVPLLRARPAPEEPAVAIADATEAEAEADAAAATSDDATEVAATEAEVNATDGVDSPVSAIELAAAERLRPDRRPESFAVAAVASEDIISGAAPRTSSRAVHRSADFATRIAPLVTARAAEATTASPALPPEPQSVTLPTRASVARAATIENAINLREVALIGIYGTADSRRALVRLASGRYIRLTLGESFSGGWRIIAMDENSIRVQKGSRTEILRISG